MKTSIILSAVGGDRPGLTQGLAEAVFAAGGNWLESHLSRLGGKYVGAILVELEAARLGELEAAVQRLNESGLHVAIAPAGEAPPAEGKPLWFELVGQDRPGIVHEVTAVLAGLGVNIDDFVTRTQMGPWQGEHLFRATARLTVPASTSPERVQAALEAISGEIMVDFTLQPV
ncbi:MAG: ACT domain-containing protein [Novosphingobium sp.]